MIWILLLLLSGLVAAYLLHPFLAAGDGKAQAQLADARAQLTVINADEASGRISEDAAAQARDALDRRILSILNAPESSTSPGMRQAVLYAVPAILFLGAVGVYSQVGSPDFQPVTEAEYRAAQLQDLPQSLEELVVVLSARLDADPNPPPDLYVILARSYFRLGDADAGLAAYDRAIELTGGAEAIVAERDAVLSRQEQRANAPRLDPDQVAAMQNMTAEEQAAMIQSMVDGLAARLEQDPNDIEGWLRLIRARTVMGDTDQARQDLAAAQSVFDKETPEGQALAAIVGELETVSED